MINKNFITHFLARKNAKQIFASFILLSVIGIFCSANLIHAQIESLYSPKSDEIAGISALMSAVANNDLSGVKFFSKAGKVMINQKNLGGGTALHIACREGNFEITKILIENGAEVNAIDNEGWTALMRASLYGNKDIVKLLLENGVQANILNSIGESALVHAATSNCSDCLDSMFEKFNFIKLMDIKLLKEQLTSSFVIAKNHDNKVAQGLIESYLDRVIKMSPLLVEKDISPAQNQNIEQVTGAKKGLTDAQMMKVFKIRSAKEDEDIEIAAPKKPIPMIAQKEDPRPKENNVSAVATVTFDVRSTAAIIKKFKLITGPQGQEVEQPTKIIIRKNKLQDIVKKEPVKTLEIPLKQRNKEVVVTIPLDEVRKVDETVLPSQVKSVNTLQKTPEIVFKLEVGEQGKVVQQKFVKKTIEEQVEKKEVKTFKLKKSEFNESPQPSNSSNSQSSGKGYKFVQSETDEKPAKIIIE